MTDSGTFLFWFIVPFQDFRPDLCSRSLTSCFKTKQSLERRVQSKKSKSSPNCRLGVTHFNKQHRRVVRWRFESLRISLLLVVGHKDQVVRCSHAERVTQTFCNSWRCISVWQWSSRWNVRIVCVDVNGVSEKYIYKEMKKTERRRRRLSVDVNKTINKTKPPESSLTPRTRTRITGWKTWPPWPPHYELHSQSITEPQVF